MSRGNRFPLLMTPEARAIFVASKLEQCGGQIAFYVRQLRSDFRALKTGNTIMGCETWTDFCKKVLKRTTRAVRYIIAGGNPRRKRNPSGKPAKDDWKEHWQGMPAFENNNLTAFQRLVVHLADQEAVNKFSKLVGQKITPKTRFIWYPRLKKTSFKNMGYVDVENGGRGSPGAGINSAPRNPGGGDER
jgi:hypothetical protein